MPVTQLRSRVDPPAAVLFDMDGTLLDSETVWDVALDDLAASLGGRLSREARAAIVGTPMVTSLRLIAADLGVTIDPQEAGRFLLERTEELFRHDLQWKPGAQQILAAVHAAGIPAALVTSTHRRLTEVALDVIGRQYFVATVCGDETERTKPDPQPYQRAAQLLGVAPADCIVLEDSVTGVTAAVAAGCAVVAVPDQVRLPDSPDYTLRSSLVGLTVADLHTLSVTHRDRIAAATD